MGNGPRGRLPSWARTRAVTLGQPSITHIPDWDGYDDPRKVALLRKIAEEAAREPKVRNLAVKILRKARVQPRDFEGQARAILKAVHDRTYYVNEPGEIIQDPMYTWKWSVRHGDCDDLAVLTAALMIAIALPWKFVLDGTKNGTVVRWIEGTEIPQGVTWGHIYGMVGTPPFRPVRWHFVEPSVKGAPLGWDTVLASSHGAQRSQDVGLYAGPHSGSSGPYGAAYGNAYGAFSGMFGQTYGQVIAAPQAPPVIPSGPLVLRNAGGITTSATTAGMRSGIRSAAIVGGTMGAEWQSVEGESKGVTFAKQVGTAVTIGVLTAVLSQIVLEQWERYRK